MPDGDERNTGWFRLRSLFSSLPVTEQNTFICLKYFQRSRWETSDWNYDVYFSPGLTGGTVLDASGGLRKSIFFCVVAVSRDGVVLCS